MSGETWAEYTVGAAGLIEAQTVRGPLIVWATKTGEGESLPHLHAPTLSPLEVQAARVNTRAHLHGFVRAARLPSRRVGGVRWKTWAKARRKRALESLESRGMRVNTRAHALAFIRGARFNTGAHFLGFVQAADGKVRHGVRWKTWAKTRKMRARRALEDLENLGHTYRLAALYVPRLTPEEDPAWRALNELLRRISERYEYEEAATIDPLLYLSLTVQVIEAAARRALWAARRVRPTFPPRTRLPRPLYARPCPPAAPLAPPVA